MQLFDRHSIHFKIRTKLRVSHDAVLIRPVRRTALAGRLVVAVLMLLAVSGRGEAAGAQPRRPSDGALCQAAIGKAERSARLPKELLDAIGLVESGRLDPHSEGVTPWPWTINVDGTGRFFETKADAILAVEAARATGAQSIDVGCMQVNLMYHPQAFGSLDQAFDPTANAIYAAGFLNRLYSTTGDWSKAAAAYHSQTPGVSEDYARRVIASWPLAARYIAIGAASMPGRPPAPPPSLYGLAGGGDGDGISQYLHDNYTPEFRMRLKEDAAYRERLQMPDDPPIRPGRGAVGRGVNRAKAPAAGPRGARLQDATLRPASHVTSHLTLGDQAFAK
jgi:hypothetical protein